MLEIPLTCESLPEDIPSQTAFSDTLLFAHKGIIERDSISAIESLLSYIVFHSLQEGHLPIH